MSSEKVKQTDWMMLNNASNHRGAEWLSAHEILPTLKAMFLENYLAVSAWILNGHSIECRQKKKQPFRLSGVRFGSQAILICG